ncbi:MAG: FMN-binding protein [Nitrospirota bacterium]|nr:FMN-binding protein [Nitrospirota bacterium]
MTGKDIFKITSNLVIVYLIGGFILAFVFANASPKIFRNNVEAEKKALKELMPEADDVTKMGDWTIHDKHAKYFIAKKGGETIGYVIQSFGKGYSSYINTFIAVDKDFRILKINILAHGETPGLGDEIETDVFKNQFIGKDIDHLKVLKTETKEYIEALSGATISTRAVSEDAVKNGIAFLIKTIREGGNKDVQSQHN